MAAGHLESNASILQGLLDQLQVLALAQGPVFSREMRLRLGCQHPVSARRAYIGCLGVVVVRPEPLGSVICSSHSVHQFYTVSAKVLTVFYFVVLA